MLTALFLYAALGAGGAADTRGPDATVPHKHDYCVRNAEGGACEDCWSPGSISSKKGTCHTLKASTMGPNVREGKCNIPANIAFCKANSK